MKNFLSCLRLNMKSALITSAYKYIPLITVCLFSCLQLWIRRDYADLTWADYVFWMNKGMPFPKDDAIIIPDGVWVFFYAYLLVMTGTYLSRSDSGICRLELLKAGSRRVWLFSKYVTCIALTLVYFLTAYASIGIFSAVFGTLSIQDSSVAAQYLDMTYVRTAAGFNMLESAAFSVVCAAALISVFFLVTHLFKAVFAYAVCSGLLIYTVYTKAPAYPGNLLMFRRCADSGAQLVMLLVCVVTCVIAAVALDVFRRDAFAKYAQAWRLG